MSVCLWIVQYVIGEENWAFELRAQVKWAKLISVTLLRPCDLYVKLWHLYGLSFGFSLKKMAFPKHCTSCLVYKDIVFKMCFPHVLFPIKKATKQTNKLFNLLCFSTTFSECLHFCIGWLWNSEFSVMLRRGDKFIYSETANPWIHHCLNPSRLLYNEASWAKGQVRCPFCPSHLEVEDFISCSSVFVYLI